ncbi:MAG: Lipid III flippase [Ignavibacteriaceae bacterium]|nr:Lipid III flippase [Ignavibacteriaceae bacterium]
MKKIILNFFKSGFSFSIITLINLFVTKFISIQSGPTGLAIYSQLKQLNQTFTVFGSLNSQNFVIKNISADSKDYGFIPTTAVLLFFTNILGFLVLLFFPMLISSSAIGKDSPEYVLAIRILAVSSFFNISYVLFSAVINGLRQITELVKKQVLSSLLAAVVSVPLIMINKPFAYSIICGSQGLFGTFLIFFYLRKIGFIKEAFHNKRLSIQWSVIKELLTYSGTLFITGMLGTLTLTGIRALYLKNLGLHSAGLFDSSYTISIMLINIVITGLTTYYFPTLSKNNEAQDRQITLNLHLTITTFVAFLLIGLIIPLREIILGILYSGEFLESQKLLKWMLVGEFLKVTYFNFGMFFLAFNKKTALLSFEFCNNMLLYFGTNFLILYYFEAYGMVYITANILYLIFAAFYVISKFKIKIDYKLLLFWLLALAGILLILFTSFSSFNIASIIIYIIFSALLGLIFRYFYYSYKLANV